MIKTILKVSGIFSSFICLYTGWNLTGLRSVGGQTVAEYYYQSVGRVFMGMALFMGPLLWGLAKFIETYENANLE